MSDGDDAPYELVLASPARRAVAETLPEVVATAVLEFVTGPLLRSPYRVGKPLEAPLKGVFSARRGAFRILYRVDEGRGEVVVIRVDHRRDSYRPH